LSTLDPSVSVEQWLPVVGFETQYEVSDHGRVRSIRTGRIRRPHLNRKGREHLDLHRDGERRDMEVHRLVLAAFAGPCPPGKEGCHNDGNPLNNHISNLRWDTRRENNIDSIKHGTHPWASRTQCSDGHEYTPENTYLTPVTGWRRRRICLARRRHAYLSRVRASSLEAAA